MPDISDKPRKFKVFMNCTGYQCTNRTEHEVEVAAGDDAEAECLEAIDQIVGDEFESGWEEIENG